MKGIMFTEDMFNAVCEGRKNQTRRKIKSVPRSVETFRDTDGTIGYKHWKEQPRYKPKEIIYIKEPYAVEYADGREVVQYRYGEPEAEERSWMNKMYMSADMARHHIRITSVKAQRLDEISENDAKDEGIDWVKDVRTDEILYKDYITGNYTLDSAVKSFFTLWDKINGVGSAKDCYVWVYRFKKDG